MHKNVTGKDLTKEAPRSPRIRVGGYAILGRTIDKCRALVAGNIGEYHFDCPLDNMLFGFKGVKGDDFKAQIENGASDQQMVERRSRDHPPVRRSRKARLVYRTNQTARTRSVQDLVVRLAGSR